MGLVDEGLDGAGRIGFGKRFYPVLCLKLLIAVDECAKSVAINYSAIDYIGRKT